MMKRSQSAAAAAVPASPHCAAGDPLDGLLEDLLRGGGGGCDADGGAGSSRKRVADAAALDELLGEVGDEGGLWNAPDLFGPLAPGLQCSEACHRPGQRCIDPGHTPHCTKCVSRANTHARFGASWRCPGAAQPPAARDAAPPHRAAGATRAVPARSLGARPRARNHQRHRLKSCCARGNLL
jgi:hypothetical protein